MDVKNNLYIESQLRVGTSPGTSNTVEVSGSVNVTTAFKKNNVDILDTTSGHDHNGTNSKKISYTNLLNTPPDINSLTESTDALNGTSDYIAIYKAASSDNRKVNLNTISKRKSTLILTGSGALPSKTDGAANQAIVEMATNKQSFYVPAFVDGSRKSVEWDVAMPDSYDGSTVIFKVYWFANNASTNSVVWGLKARAYGDGNSLDQAYGTEVTVTDANNANAAINISADSSALTIGGSPAGGNLVHFCLSRIGADEADTLTSDAYLDMVVVEFGVNKWSDG